MIGQTVSHYRIIGELGAGGMGVVYKAEDTKLKRTVALKFLPHGLTQDKAAKTRFIREAQAASALQHNNICAIHEIDETKDGRLFISMDCYDGETLKEKIAKGPLPVDEAIDIGGQVAEGLAKAHESGMVHRDIKPANILVTTDGIVKILDFGLAKLAGQTRVTKTGTTVGTVAYMSPEQATGTDIDHRSDIFSWGAVFYEMLTGELPFKGDHEAAVLYGITNNDPPPLGKYRADIPEDLRRVVDTTLRKEPGERYQNASEVAEDLSRFRKGVLTTGYTGAGAKTVRSWILITAVSILAVTAGYLVYSRFLSPKPEGAGASRKMIAVLPFENLGPPEDEYFADGMTEEITARLAGVRELGVIARTSALQYKNTSKTIAQIGDELGVDYIMEGTIRWQRSSEATSRIRMTPQLIRVSDATHIWADIYDEPVIDVFEVQTGIANRVIDALGITLLDSERRSLESLPTSNFDAYTYYLHGRDCETKSYTETDQRRAEQAYKNAIEQDPGFALAYARLSEVHAEVYFQHYDRSEERAAMAKRAADEALRLSPDLAEAHKALGKYYYVYRLEYDLALHHYETAATSRPNNAGILAGIGFVERRRGEWTRAVETIKRASELDPRSALLAAEVGGTYALLRDYPRADRYFDRAISLDPEVPDFYIWQWRSYLARDGGTKGAKDVLQEARAHVDEESLAEEMLITDILDRKYEDALNRLVPVTSETVGTGRGFVSSYVPTVQYYAEIYNLMGEDQMAQSYYDSARVLIEERIGESPDDPKFRAALGIAYAGLGRSEDAIREGKLAVELLPVSKEAITGCRQVEALAKIYTMIDEHDAAIDELDYLLSIPGELSAPMLQLDPDWVPLREHPRFRELLDKYPPTR